MWLVGRAGDWNVPASPGVVAQIDSFTQRIQVEELAARVGSSGGPLISSDGIVGMIVMDNDLYTEVTPIEPIQSQVRDKWHYVWQLTGRREIAKAPLAPQPGSTPAVACGGNSDEQVTRPIFALYDAINRKDINLYAAQWADDGVYMRADTGTMISRQQKISNRRADFARWQSATITREKVSILEKTSTMASINLVYSLAVGLSDGRVVKDSHVAERYEVRCNTNGKWLIERNVDYVDRSR